MDGADTLIRSCDSLGELVVCGLGNGFWAGRWVVLGTVLGTVLGAVLGAMGLRVGGCDVTGWRLLLGWFVAAVLRLESRFHLYLLVHGWDWVCVSDLSS